MTTRKTRILTTLYVFIAAPVLANFGDATFYSQDGNAGACEKIFPDTAFIAAINGVRADGNCFKCATITHPISKKSVKVQITDECPECEHMADIDLSLAAFDAIEARSVGRFKVDWEFVSCDGEGSSNPVLAPTSTRTRNRATTQKESPPTIPETKTGNGMFNIHPATAVAGTPFRFPTSGFRPKSDGSQTSSINNLGASSGSETNLAGVSLLLCSSILALLVF